MLCWLIMNNAADVWNFLRISNRGVFIHLKKFTPLILKGNILSFLCIFWLETFYIHNKSVSFIIMSMLFLNIYTYMCVCVCVCLSLCVCVCDGVCLYVIFSETRFVPYNFDYQFLALFLHRIKTFKFIILMMGPNILVRSSVQNHKSNFLCISLMHLLYLIY